MAESIRHQLQMTFPRTDEPRATATLVSWASETTDDRRNKRYSRTLTIAVYFGEPGGTPEHIDWFRQVPTSALVRNLLETARCKLAERIAEPAGDIKPFLEVVTLTPNDVTGDSSVGWRGITIWLRFILRTSKPSLIPPDDVCLAALSQGRGILGLWDELLPAIDAAFDERVREDQIKARLRESNHVLDQLVAEIVEESREACRWEQRYAALVAELNAEKRLRAHKAAAKLREEGLTYSDTGTKAHPTVVEAVARALDEAKCLESKGIPGRWPFEHNETWIPELPELDS